MARHKGSDSAHKGRFHVLACRHLAAAIALPADGPRLLRARDRLPDLWPAGVIGLPQARYQRGLRDRRLGIWMPGCCQFLTGTCLFLGLTLVGTHRPGIASVTLYRDHR